MKQKLTRREPEEAPCVVGGFSAQGFSCEVNQDRFRIFDEGFVLCDGMGGLDAGEVAAEASCWQCREQLRQGCKPADSLSAANESIIAVGEALGQPIGAAACVVRYGENNTLEIGVKGDIAVISVNGGEVSLLNDRKALGSTELASFLGKKGTVNFTETIWTQRPTAPEDGLVLVSDGVWRLMTLDEVQDICCKDAGNPQAAARHLVEIARSNGSMDDCSAVVCMCANRAA